LQFLVQSIGVIVLRIRRPDMPRPFRMWLYPVPALVAAGSFIFILRDRWREVRYAGVILVVGLMIYCVRAWRRGEWPFEGSSLDAGR
jgi:amino acid transporter